MLLDVMPKEWRRYYAAISHTAVIRAGWTTGKTIRILPLEATCEGNAYSRRVRPSSRFR